MKLVEQWWKKATVWMLSALGIISGLYQYMPELQQYIPAKYLPFVVLVILIVRVISQKPKDANP